MAAASNDTEQLAEKVRAAITKHDFDAFGALLSDDVHWGTQDNPRSCRNKKEVLATFASGVARGFDGTVGEVVAGSQGVLCQLNITRAPEDRQLPPSPLYHVYLVRDGYIYLIEPHHDRTSAARAAGVR